MKGLMQNWPLTVDKILDHANRNYPDREIVSRSVEGPIVTTTYREVYERFRRTESYLATASGQLPGIRRAISNAGTAPWAWARSCIPSTHACTLIRSPGSQMMPTTAS